eukprot:Polyplicarium_translucidae@DN4670_c0_g1_i1.p1
MRKSDFERIDGARTIGKGFFGVVRRMRHRGTGVIVAVKEVPKATIQQHNLESQIRREVEILRSLRHENIIRLLYFWEEKDEYLLAMECANGGVVFNKLKEEGKFSPLLAAFYALSVIKALAYIHGHRYRILHRDLKPENLLLDSNGILKVADFGWASMLKPFGEDHAAPRETFCGTLDYLAPEMVRGDAYGEAVDRWSVGVLLYEFLTGLAPFAARSQSEVFEKILRADVMWPPDIDADGRDLIQRLLRPEPSERLSLQEAAKHPF